MKQDTPQDFVRRIQQGFDPDQPWNRIPPKIIRKSTGFKWNESVLRRGFGDSLRTPGIESIVTSCPRRMAFSMYGVSTTKMNKGETTYMNQWGGPFNDEIDRIIGSDPFGDMIAGNAKTKPYVNKKGETGLARQGQVFIPARPFTMADGKKIFGFSGVWDFYNETTHELIELKTVLSGDEAWGMPTHPGQKAFGQACAYIHATPTARGCWLIYLPTDLSTLRWDDPTTFASFWISREDAEKEYVERIVPNVAHVLQLLRTVGQKPSRFYSVVDSLPACDRDFCCPAEKAFRASIEINDDWTFRKIS